jgi:LIVCS family branched-chain amino acid:cation transporter
MASVVAGIFLFLVYGGLCYLGATVSTLYPENVDKGQLVMAISHHIDPPRENSARKLR